MQAKQATIARKGHMPDWQEIVAITARHWKVPKSAVNKEMLIAMIRHRFTDYDTQLQELSQNNRTQQSSTIFYEASEILRGKANQLANHLYDQAYKRALKEQRMLVKT